MLDEYIGGENPVFIGPDVHIGTDEYNKKEAEQYRYFTDRYLKYIEKYGKTPRMWGGLKWLPGKTPVKAEGVTVNAWSYDWVDPEVSLKDGYKLINTCDTYLYIVPGAGYYREFLDHQWLYETWTPWMINRKQTLPEALRGYWAECLPYGMTSVVTVFRNRMCISVLSGRSGADRKTVEGRQQTSAYKAFEALCKEMPERRALTCRVKFLPIKMSP